MRLAPNTKPGQHRTFGEMMAEHRQMVSQNPWMSTEMLELRLNNARYLLEQESSKGRVIERIARASVIAYKEALNNR